MLKKVLFGVVMLAGVVLIFGQKYLVHAEAVDVMNNKLATEARMEERIKLVLASYLGTDNIIATVRVNLSRTGGAASEVETVTTDGKKKIRGWDDTEEIILPGVPAANSMVKKDKTKIELSKARFGVASINVTLLIGKKINDRSSEKVREIVINMFGLDLDAGDTLTVETYEPLIKASDKKGMSNIEMILIGFILLLAFYLFGPLKHSMDVFNQNLLSIGSKAVGGGVSGSTAEEFGAIAGDEDEGSGKEIHATLLPSAIAGDATHHFAGSIIGEEIMSFNKLINSETIEDLKLALTNEPSDIIVKVISHLPSKYALAAIPNHRVTEVLAQYTNVGFENLEELKNIVGKIRIRVEGSFGGASRLSKIVQVMDKSAQDSVLNMLRNKNMEFARIVENRIFRFEDVLNYDDQHLRRIFRKAGADAFANCLKSQPDAIVQKFYSKLGPSITTLITNRLSVMVSNARSTEAELEILGAVEKLGEKGFIPTLEQVKQNIIIAEQSQF